jgi:predicted RNase H-like HicB family nuclease
MSRQESVAAQSAAYVCHFQPEPEGGYTVTCPSLPPVVTFGETLDEARAMVREAIELCLEVYRDQGLPIPPSDPDPRAEIDELVPIHLSRA